MVLVGTRMILCVRPESTVGNKGKECIKSGASPRNAGGGIFASAPDRWIPGVDSGDGPDRYRN